MLTFATTRQKEQLLLRNCIIKTKADRLVSFLLERLSPCAQKQGDENRMKTQEKVLEILYSKNDAISGEEIASTLGVSRNSVWKAINGLKALGYEIESSGIGYRLLSRGLLDEYSVKKHLRREHKLFIYKKENSSNDIAKQLARQGVSEGGTVIVLSQTGGKGRMGRSFISNSENGLYMSIILRPQIQAAQSVSITVAGAVAVLEAIEHLSGKECSIKWVNDIYIGEKKCCGILTEASLDFESGRLQYAVIGVGVNLCPPKGGFDKEIEEIACGVYENECPPGFKSKLCAEIINRFFDHYEELEKKKYIDTYRKKSSIIGKAVDVYVGNEIISGVATDIDENANLVVKGENGQSYVFGSGEARVRKAAK